MELKFDGRPSDSPLVESIWRAQTERAGSFVSSADIHSELVITCYQGQTFLTVRGPETRATPVDYPADVEFFGIVLKLGTFIPELPAKNLMDRKDIVLPEATPTSFWLDGSRWQFPTYENADTFIAQLVRKGLLVHEPVVDAVLHGHLDELSWRSVQRRFLQSTGLTHKAVQQIERAKSAVSLLRQGVSILDTVDEMGYFDQSHLTNSLKRFMGQTPAQIVRLDQPD